MPLMRPQNTTASKPLSAFNTAKLVSTAAFSLTDSVWPHAGAITSSPELRAAASIRNCPCNCVTAGDLPTQPAALFAGVRNAIFPIGNSQGDSLLSSPIHTHSPLMTIHLFTIENIYRGLCEKRDNSLGDRQPLSLLKQSVCFATEFWWLTVTSRRILDAINPIDLMKRLGSSRWE